MRYLGGKARLAKRIVSVLRELRPRGAPFYEPMVGGCHITPLMDGKRFASDIHPDLILMWRALQSGWMPPEHVSESEYQKLKTAGPSALRGFVGFGCSFGGRWFEGYARGGHGADAETTRRVLLRTVPSIKTVSFACRDYMRVKYAKNSLVYFDPPYADRKSYSSRFDHGAFWDFVRNLSGSCIVIVSEYRAPSDFVAVASFQRKQNLRGGNVNGVGGEPEAVHDCLWRFSG